jgi:hypothetical protein
MVYIFSSIKWTNYSSCIPIAKLNVFGFISNFSGAYTYLSWYKTIGDFYWNTFCKISINCKIETDTIIIVIKPPN